MDYQSIITFFMEMAGTVAFAASGENRGNRTGASVLSGVSYSCRRRYDPGYCAGDYTT